MDHMRSPWYLLSDNRASTQDVAQALTNMHLVDGLIHNQPPSCSDPQLMTFEADILARLTKGWNLEEAEASRLLNSFCRNEFCGSQQDFMGVAGNMGSHRGLRSILLGYMLDERQFLLSSIEHIIQYSRDPSHPNSAIYEQFLEKDDTGQKMRDSLLDQLRLVDAALPLKVPDSEMTAFYEDASQQALAWLTANLGERIIILRSLIRYVEIEKQIRPQAFVKLLSSVNLENFPVDAHFILHNSVLHLHSVLVLNLIQNSSLQWFEELEPFADQIEKELDRLSSISPAYSPVIVGWMVMNSRSTHGRRDKAEALGLQALKKAPSAARNICCDSAVQFEPTFTGIVGTSLTTLFRMLMERAIEDTVRLEAEVFIKEVASLTAFSSDSVPKIRAKKGDYAHLVKYKVDRKVLDELDQTYSSDLEVLELIACGAMKALCTELTVKAAVSALKKVRRYPLQAGFFKHGQICDIIKEYRRKLIRFATTPEDMASITKRTNYPMAITSLVCSYGPPLNWAGSAPSQSCEVLIRHLPLDASVNVIIPLLEKIGLIYEIRLMMHPTSGLNRGFAFVKFTSEQSAQDAIEMLNGYEIKEETFLRVEISRPNTRLVVFIADSYTKKEEILELFKKYVCSKKVGAATVMDIEIKELDTYFYDKVTNLPGETPFYNCGSCFLEFHSHEDASLAYDRIFSKKNYWTRRRIVGWADPKFEPDLSHVTRLFIRPLPKKLDGIENTLKILFGPFGCTGVEKKNGEQYANVSFLEHDDAVYAMTKLQGRYIFDHNLEIKLSKPDDPNQEKRRRLVEEGDRVAKEVAASTVCSGLKRCSLEPSAAPKRSKK